MVQCRLQTHVHRRKIAKSYQHRSIAKKLLQGWNEQFLRSQDAALFLRCLWYCWGKGFSKLKLKFIVLAEGVKHSQNNKYMVHKGMGDSIGYLGLKRLD